MTRLLVLAPLAFAAILIVTPARAAEETPDLVNAAAAHFKRALQLVDSGEYEPALQEFRRAHETLPRYQVLYNIGLVLKLLDRPKESRETLERYLKEGGDAIPADRRTEVLTLIQGMQADRSDRREPASPAGERPPPAAAAAVVAPVQPQPPSASTPAGSPETGLLIARQPDRAPPGAGKRAGPVVAISAASVGVAALSIYLWNHTRWQRWNDEDGRLSMTVAPSEPTEVDALVQRQARNDQLIDSVHRIDRVALGLGITAGVGGLLAWWLWSPAEQQPVPSLAVNMGSSSVSFSWGRRF